MGVDLMVLSNHKLKGKSFNDRLREVEEELNTEIKFIENVPRKKENEPLKTDIINEVIFYIDGKNSEHYFEAIREISIKTNYQYCFGIRFFEQIMKIIPAGTSYKYFNWKNALGCDIGLEWSDAELKEYSRRWNEFQKFQFNIAKKLGGNKFIYIDDTNFQESEELIYEGRSLEELIIDVENTKKLFDIDELYNNLEFISDNYPIYGFYEEI